MARVYRWAAVLIWLGLIFWLSSQPVLPGVGGPGIDSVFKKLAHVVVYAVLALLFAWALHTPPGPIRRRAIWLAFALTVGYAITDEIHQSFVPRRGSHVTDVLLDALAAGLALGILWRRARPRTGQAGERPFLARPDPMGYNRRESSSERLGGRGGQRGPRQEGYL